MIEIASQAHYDNDRIALGTKAVIETEERPKYCVTKSVLSPTRSARARVGDNGAYQPISIGLKSFHLAETTRQQSRLFLLALLCNL